MVNIADKRLPSLCWMPKLHGTPCKGRFVAGSVSCAAGQLSVCFASALGAVGCRVAKFCNKVYENGNVGQFWSVEDALEVIDKIDSRKYKVSQVGACEFSTLYAALPHALVGSKLVSLIERTFAGEGCLCLALDAEAAFIAGRMLDDCIVWTGLGFCAALAFLVDGLFVGFGGGVFWRIVAFLWVLVVRHLWLAFFVLLWGRVCVGVGWGWASGFD
ncbi:hypothetical protein DPMN_106972 [Dreissena polymorpha]|uniref:Uncharacterized protein n=1 Tax=Dreissena polymorpha TaxID=45954 RepID=A0A9D4K675_DREPO|nr:hypothetical protein DPMN_106972 [Dreissena polymorpha]